MFNISEISEEKIARSANEAETIDSSMVELLESYSSEKSAGDTNSGGQQYLPHFDLLNNEIAASDSASPAVVKAKESSATQSLSPDNLGYLVAINLPPETSLPYLAGISEAARAVANKATESADFVVDSAQKASEAVAREARKQAGSATDTVQESTKNVIEKIQQFQEHQDRTTKLENLAKQIILNEVHRRVLRPASQTGVDIYKDAMEGVKQADKFVTEQVDKAMQDTKTKLEQTQNSIQETAKNVQGKAEAVKEGVKVGTGLAVEELKKEVQEKLKSVGEATDEGLKTVEELKKQGTQKAVELFDKIWK